MPRKNWIDYASLKKETDFHAVLEHYGVNCRLKGSQVTAFCPLPGHSGEGKKSPSFSANLDRNIYQCFGCGGKGNVIEFVAAMEGLDPNNADEFRKAAETLVSINGGQAPTSTPHPAKPSKPKEDGRERVINAPLPFSLKSLDTKHPYLADRGFSIETTGHFGLGFCNRGLMEGRIAIPLWDDAGTLIGYAGRLVDEKAIDADHPKYLLPGDREKDGVVYEFKRSHLLYNGHSISQPTDDLILVEGFSDVWAIHQAGYGQAVATMSASLSDEQAQLIINKVTTNGRVWIISDGDDAGDRLALDVLNKVGPHRACRRLLLPTGDDPASLSSDDLADLLSVI